MAEIFAGFFKIESTAFSGQRFVLAADTPEKPLSLELKDSFLQLKMQLQNTAKHTRPIFVSASFSLGYKDNSWAFGLNAAQIEGRSILPQELNEFEAGVLEVLAENPYMQLPNNLSLTLEKERLHLFYAGAPEALLTHKERPE